MQWLLAGRGWGWHSPGLGDPSLPAHGEWGSSSPSPAWGLEVLPSVFSTSKCLHNSEGKHRFVLQPLTEIYYVNIHDVRISSFYFSSSLAWGGISESNLSLSPQFAHTSGDECLFKCRILVVRRQRKRGVFLPKVHTDVPLRGRSSSAHG